MRGLRSILGQASRNWPSKPSRELSDRGRLVAEAIEATALPRAAEDWVSRIEARRAELLGSSEMLGAWERPWLAASPELQARLKLSAADERFETSITLAKACEASKPEKWGRALLSLVLATKPKCVVEMGTNVGISGLYLAAGLKVNGVGHLLTMEGAPSKAVVATQGFERENLDAEVVVGDFADTLDATLKRAGPVDIAFIDGFHEGAATVTYHDAFKQVAAPGAVLVYDDVNWSDGMKRAWATIQADASIDFALDFDAIGIVGLRQ